ncbi:hypothetical protein [Paenibacillus oleatilyticus]|uniref:hypothetical protein n=1 Tax=Paenibacillus oleatilyticus TaxID=2594886 RepID=UPI001C1F3635|nr:hypothetical protein [Paenibacillus oleatilyticus]MBU7316533.1 hypothetical protein [Paenibacillus oleatilyticus]
MKNQLHKSSPVAQLPNAAVTYSTTKVGKYNMLPALNDDFVNGAFSRGSYSVIKSARILAFALFGIAQASALGRTVLTRGMMPSPFISAAFVVVTALSMKRKELRFEIRRS